MGQKGAFLNASCDGILRAARLPGNVHAQETRIVASLSLETQGAADRITLGGRQMTSLASGVGYCATLFTW